MYCSVYLPHRTQDGSVDTGTGLHRQRHRHDVIRPGLLLRLPDVSGRLVEEEYRLTRLLQLGDSFT